jgi:hypothetical protein
VNKRIEPARVRYIKLGEGGGWEKDCLAKSVVRIGFGSAMPERFRMWMASRWDDLSASFVAGGRSKSTASRFGRELRLFFEDDGRTLWITFIEERLYWGFVSGPPTPAPEQDGVDRPIDGGWKWKDLMGDPLTKDRLSGALTKLAAYRGTSCDVDKADYVVRRINGEKTPEVEHVLSVVAEMKTATLGLMRLLGPRDFELLVDLVFTTSGWRRVGVVGKTQKTLDLDVVLPSTGERAFVQVKSHTTSSELAEYVAHLDDRRMFYVFHSGRAATDDERVTVIGPEHLADLVMDAGLVSWLIRKVS